MSEPHDELLEAIVALRRLHPHWRLGQLVANLADWADTNIWDIEDDRILEAAQSHLLQRENANVDVSGGPKRDSTAA